jgi:two-component sensor histidine kinase
MLSGDSLRRMNREFNTTEAGFYSIKAYKDLIFSATLNGLFILNTKTKKLRYISEQDGLNSELVYSIEFAENHKALWIGTNQGVNKLNLKKYLDSGIVEIAPFGKQQGFMGVECNSNGIWEDPDGSIWFGTVSGLVKHEPFNLKRNNVPNTINIENIKLFSEDTLLPDNSKLPSGYNTITFYYRGICLTNPEKVLYQKKLDGLEKDWSFSSNEDYSKYANLAPGKYTFRVKSCNNEGLWDGNEATFTFTILRPFYATWWFILVVVVGAASLIYIVVMLRIRNIKRKQKAEYDRKVEVSRIELKALRSQMNPHFIFNSLNSIQHYIFHTKSEEAIKYLNKFARLVRIILNNSEKPTVTVGDDIEALKLYLELEQMRFEDKFDYEVNIDATVDTDYDIMPPLLMQPYVENAILHGLNPKPGRGKLTISLTSENNYLICTITDNGIGREKAAEIKRTMPVNKHKSLGMKITEDRLKILNEVNNSQLSVNITDLKGANGEALGTRVELFVPYL